MFAWESAGRSKSHRFWFPTMEQDENDTANIGSEFHICEICSSGYVAVNCGSHDSCKKLEELMMVKNNNKNHPFASIQWSLKENVVE